MFRKLDKIERKILIGMIGKFLNFIRTLSPEEVNLLSKIIGSILRSKIEIEDDGCANKENL